MRPWLDNSKHIFFGYRLSHLLKQLMFISLLLVGPKYFLDFDLEGCFGIIIFQIVEHIRQTLEEFNEVYRIIK